MISATSRSTAMESENTQKLRENPSEESSCELYFALSVREGQRRNRRWSRRLQDIEGFVSSTIENQRSRQADGPQRLNWNPSTWTEKESHKKRRANEYYN
jgi:hypothetical protein